MDGQEYYRDASGYGKMSVYRVGRALRERLRTRLEPTPPETAAEILEVARLKDFAAVDDDVRPGTAEDEDDGGAPINDGLRRSLEMVLLADPEADVDERAGVADVTPFSRLGGRMEPVSETPLPCRAGVEAEADFPTTEP